MAFPSPKVVLVCLGERKREVSFSGGYDSLLQQANETYKDVLCGRRINVLQLKNEDWEGQFVDIQNKEIADKSVVRACVVPVPEPFGRSSKTTSLVQMKPVSSSFPLARYLAS